jgi:hypothetical protein
MYLGRIPLALVVIFLLLIPGLFWGVPSALNPQVDAPVPLGSLLFFADRRPEINTTYPAFHELLMLPVYAVALGIYRVIGGFHHISSTWPYGFRDVSGFFSSLLILTNFMAALMGTMLLWLGLQLVEPRRKWAWFALLFLGTNSVFVYYSRTGNLDIPYNFWLTVMLFFIWRFLILGGDLAHALVPAGIAGAFATGTKDQASGMVIGTCVVLLCYGPALKTVFRERIRNTALFALTVGVAYALVAILPNPGRWVHHVVFVTGPHATTSLARTPFGEVQILLHTLQWLVNIFTIPVLVLCVLGAWRMWSTGMKRGVWVLLTPLIAYYLIVIARTMFAPPRFMIPFMIPVLVFTTYGVAWVAEQLSGRRTLQIAWVGALGALLVFQFVNSYVPVTYMQLFDVRRAVAADLPSLVPPGSPLLIARMQGVNYPNADVYEHYKLMMVPGDPIRPASHHASHIFHPFDPNVQYYLLGTGGSGLPWHEPVGMPPLTGELLKQWRCPEWMRERLIVPCFFEFYLYRVNGPVPGHYDPPPDKQADNAG